MKSNETLLKRIFYCGEGNIFYEKLKQQTL